MSKSVAYKHISRALSQWPKDTLRPECQFQNVLQRRIDKKHLPATNASSGPSAGATPAAKSIGSDISEMEQANILYSLLENRYIKRYPIKGTLMTPLSKPTHYTDLIKEIEVAPKRSWFERTTNKWKGFLRFQ